MKQVFFIFFILLEFAGCSYATDKKDLISIGIGEYDFLRDHHRTIEGRIEWKPGVEYCKFRPLLGVMFTAQGAVYTYGGVSFVLSVQKKFFIEPNFAAGYYYDGGGKKLGYPLEFRSGIEIGREFANQSRIGFHFYHISNASIGRRNPGEESLVVFYAFPIERKKRSNK